jgi:hypothetical protein
MENNISDLQTDEIPISFKEKILIENLYKEDKDTLEFIEPDNGKKVKDKNDSEKKLENYEIYEEPPQLKSSSKNNNVLLVSIFFLLLNNNYIIEYISKYINNPYVSLSFRTIIFTLVTFFLFKN